MKYGIVANIKSKNVGDDIQSYADAQFLPSVDYIIDRENLDTFESINHEKVATIMNGWFLGKKWNWPPSNDIYPIITSMHNTNFTGDTNKDLNGSPIYDEWLTGVGGEYFNHYGPVGARDMHTLECFRRHNIDSFFSGCITLTLPKQLYTEDKGKYILLVDLDPQVQEKVKNKLSKLDIEVKVIGNNRPKPFEEDKLLDWEYRKKDTEKYLSLYQNARCVVTRRLHVSLPCLAMEVPVLCIFKPESTRFDPYYKLMHFVSNKDYLKNGYEYDFLNPPENPKDYLEIREKLIQSVTDFVSKCQKISNEDAASIELPEYTELEMLRWKVEIMRNALHEYRIKYRRLVKALSKLNNLIKKYQNNKIMKRLLKRFTA